MVERLHRQLKASIMAHEHQNWTEVLPLVLLGIRTAYKESIQSSAAELVHGTPLTLPGEFLATDPQSENITEDFGQQLRDHMQQLPFKTPRQNDHVKPFVSKDLLLSDHVFLRRDFAKTPLQQPYEGPFKVLNKEKKTFTIDYKGQRKVVSIDRLKPAYIAEQPATTRSGRIVRQPKKLRFSLVELEGGLCSGARPK